MKLGGEPKKVAILIGLLVVAAYFFLSSDDSDAPSSTPPRAVQRQTGPPAAKPAPPRAAPRQTAARPVRGGGREFRPTLKPRRPEDRPDPMTIDPTLRLDLLAKLQAVTVDGVTRSLFEFGKEPPPKAPEPTLSAEKMEEIKKKQQEAAAELASKEPPKPPPPPIQLKFYGYVSPVATDDKRAFFLNGEDIFVASEGEVIQKRYKVIRIGVNSAVVEDTEHDHQQTLKLEEVRG